MVREGLFRCSPTATPESSPGRPALQSVSTFRSRHGGPNFPGGGALVCRLTDEEKMRRTARQRAPKSPRRRSPAGPTAPTSQVSQGQWLADGDLPSSFRRAARHAESYIRRPASSLKKGALRAHPFAQALQPTNHLSGSSSLGSSASHAASDQGVVQQHFGSVGRRQGHWPRRNVVGQASNSALVRWIWRAFSSGNVAPKVDDRHRAAAAGPEAGPPGQVPPPASQRVEGLRNRKIFSG